MQLFYSQTSPFARKCRMVSRLPGTSMAVEEIAQDPFADDNYRKINPLGKVPALVDGDITLFDSPLICEYLDNKRVGLGGESIFRRDSADYFKAQLCHAHADGIIDAAVSIVMERRRDTEHSDFWLDRWFTSIETAVRNVQLDTLDTEDKPHIGTVATTAALGYLDFRLADKNWRPWNRPLATWFENISKQDWVIETQPPS